MAEVIGQGRFATVKRCIEQSTKCECALKVVDKRDVTKEELSLLKNEVQMMKTIRHANIIELFHDWETALHMYIIMEFANIGDLGLATTVSQPLFTVCGTPTYVAPEVISEVGYGLEVDVWSLGILTYILLCGYPPFSSDIDDQDELFDQIQSGKYEFESPYWDHVTEEAKGLINDMLDIDPKKRLTASDVFHHDWILVGFTRLLKQQPKQQQQQHDWNGDTKKNDVIINNNSSSMQQSQHISNNNTATTADETAQQHQFTIIDDDDIDDVIDKTTASTTTSTTSSTTLMNHLKSDLVRIQSVHRLPQTHSAPGVLNGLMDRKLKYIGCKKQIHMSPRKKHPPISEEEDEDGDEEDEDGDEEDEDGDEEDEDGDEEDEDADATKQYIANTTDTSLFHLQGQQKSIREST
ncbi:hypothetical protein HELRODRAFT_194983 [Helobdella robusta]|uniref:Protein kinase domain-containing protein n=1 Tax=Helobdella robusta TaxID=6412 RepID=T1FWM4_HELRO|nr:hypothetical protein HELRODRAFT_194983 [Helobdella robusta]ESO09815.1 hypothetical protein HELRODRAFT_194983 [Helobdella robusta]